MASIAALFIFQAIARGTDGPAVGGGFELNGGYLKLRGLAVYSSLSVKTLRKFLREGLPCFRLDGVILVRISDFDEFISRYKLGRSAEELADEMMK